ncbi:unnamed protein product [Symbiodinium sp. CCMP2592]|nr:unnamed protein product [Symbiodinium sp. CCMP2592]
MHADEGTSFRRAGIYQQSWGPIIKAGPASALHCFFYTAMLADDYKEDHVGYGAGNNTLDSLMRHFVEDAMDCYLNGVPSRQGLFYIVILRLEGDLPAQAKLSHSGRNYTNDPNPICSWCLADGRQIPFGDFRRTAAWRATISQQPPWMSRSPLHDLPGGEDVRFLSKDLFHISQLGITRTCVASVICFLVTMGHFQPLVGGTSVPACLKEAYKDFGHYCKAVLHETPDVKTFTRENLQWTSRAKLPDTSWKGSDARLLTKWLVDYLSRPFLLDEISQHVFELLYAIDDFHRLCYKQCARIWMNEAQMEAARKSLGRFLVNYSMAAKKCHDRGWLFFNITPKYHYMLHIEHDLRMSMGHEWGFNPACFATEMDEDYMGSSLFCVWKVFVRLLGDSGERKPPHQNGCPDPLSLEPHFVPSAQSFPSVRPPPSMVEPVSATILAGLAADFFVGWMAKKAFFKGCRTVKDILECLEKDVVKTTSALSDYLQENFDKDRSGCLSPEAIQAGLRKLRQDLPKLTDAGQRASMTYIMGLMLYAETACASLKENGPATEKRLRSFVPPYASLDKKRAQIELIVCSFIRSAQHKTLLEKIEARLESKTAEYAEDILWETIEEPLKEAVGAIVKDVLGSAVPDAMSLFIYFLEVV